MLNKLKYNYIRLRYGEAMLRFYINVYVLSVEMPRYPKRVNRFKML